MTASLGRIDALPWYRRQFAAAAGRAAARVTGGERQKLLAASATNLCVVVRRGAHRLDCHDSLSVSAATIGKKLQQNCDIRNGICQLCRTRIR